MTRRALLLLLAGCAKPPAAPPPPQLQPQLEALRREAEAQPAPLDEARRRALADLIVTAFEPGAADERLATQAQQSLRDATDRRPALEAALLHESPAVRANAAFELGLLGERAALVPLVLRLKYELDPEPRAWAAGALDQLGCRAGLGPLAAAIRAREAAETSGRIALEILGRAGVALAEQPTWDELIAGLEKLHDAWLERGEVPDLPPPAAADRALLDARIAEQLRALEEFQLRPVDDARFVLARLGRLAVPALARALTAQETYLRSYALEVVEQLGPVAAEACTGPALALLGDGLTRAAAIEALGAMRARAAYDSIAPLLASPDPELRVAAAGALGPIGDPRAIPALEQRMRDTGESMDVRVQAAFSLALFELDRPGLAFLKERKARADYHEATVRMLLERIEREARR